MRETSKISIFLEWSGEYLLLTNYNAHNTFSNTISLLNFVDHRTITVRTYGTTNLHTL